MKRLRTIVIIASILALVTQLSLAILDNTQTTERINHQAFVQNDRIKRMNLKVKRMRQNRTNKQLSSM